MADGCKHLQAVVDELERRGHRRLRGWSPHRNDILHIAYLAPQLEARELTKLDPDNLVSGGHTGCYRATHSHVHCRCEAGAWCAVLLADKPER